MVKRIFWLGISSAIAFVAFSLYFLPSSLFLDPQQDFQAEPECQEGWVKTILPTGVLCTKEEPTQKMIDEFSGTETQNAAAGTENQTNQAPDNQSNLTKQESDNQFPILEKIRNSEYSKDGWDEQKRQAFIEELHASDFWKSHLQYIEEWEQSLDEDWDVNHINEVFTCENYQELAYEYRTDYYLESMVYEKYIQECKIDKEE